MNVQNLSVCTGTKRTCVQTCARGAGTHGDVFERTHGDVLSGHTEFRSVSHTTTHNTHTTPHGERDRDRQRQRKEDRDWERREDGRGREKRREEKTKEDKTRQEKREISFLEW